MSRLHFKDRDVQRKETQREQGSAAFALAEEGWRSLARVRAPLFWQSVSPEVPPEAWLPDLTPAQLLVWFTLMYPKSGNPATR